MFARALPGMDHTRICVVALVGEELPGPERGKQDVSTIEIAGLPTAEVKAQWIAQCVSSPRQ